MEKETIKVKVILRQKTSQKLDELGSKWTELDPEKDESARKNIQSEIFCILYNEFGGEKFTEDQTEAQSAALDELGNFFLHDWRLFDGTKSALSAFVSKRLENRIVDSYRKDNGMHRERQEASDDFLQPVIGEDGKRVMKSQYVQNESLNRKITADDDKNEEEYTLLDVYADPSNEQTSEKILLRKSFGLDFFTLAMNFVGKLSGHAKNESRLNYYRMFFTDRNVSLLKTVEKPSAYVRHERDIFDAMKLPFLDYFMAAECRSVPALVYTGLKPYEALADGHEGVTDEPKQPLPHDVYIAYLKRVEDKSVAVSTLSEQRKAWESFVKDNLGLTE